MKYDIVIFREFTKPEIDNFIENCNFTKNKERNIPYYLKYKGKSNVEIALEMIVSERQPRSVTL